MLKKYIFFCLVFPLISIAQDKFSELDKSGMETTILLDRAFSITNLIDDSQKINSSYFIQVYSELSKADYGSNFQNISTLKEASKIGFVNNYVPIGIIHTKFDVIKPSVIRNGLLTQNVQGHIISSSKDSAGIFETHQRTFASPLAHRTKGLQTTFRILPELITNSTEELITSIKIDFNDNNGFRAVNFGEDILINFSSEGEKQIDFEITFNDGTVRQNSAFIVIQMSSADYNAIQGPGDEGPITNINSSISYQGFGETMAHVGTGEYKIYFDNVDGVLDKPIFFVDGFDPNDTRTIPTMYNLLNFGNPIQNLAELVRDEGFDLVVLNFPTYTSSSDNTTIISGGADFIQRNAFILVELMNTINAMKVGNEENVVIGPSMGGLISRYALRYMEQNMMDHETRLYLSFDSPHLGANVPMGIQYMFNYLVNGDPGITAAEPLVNGLLNSAAAKQMLIDHYSAHLQGGSEFLQDTNITLPVGAPDFRNAFQTEIDAMGFPQNTRNVSMVNGSKLGALTGTQGMVLLSNTFDTGVVSGFPTRAIVNLNFTPFASQTITVTDFVSQVFIGAWQNAFTPYMATSESPSFTDGLDSAPGGQFDMNDLDDGSSTLITDFVNNLATQYFDFIPTLSGLAITETNNWYDLPNVTNRNTTSVQFSTPFVSTYIPDFNEPHVLLTDLNVAFALDEITGAALGVSNFDLSAQLKLERNPIGHELVLLSNQNLGEVTMSLVDMTGKVLIQNNLTLSNRTEIPISVSKGLYILRIDHLEKGSFVTKVIVN